MLNAKSAAGIANRELWLAFIAIVFITVIYLGMIVLLEGIPSASGFFGHSIGILGFILMLMTETLYSLRKRSRSARWGRMADWLNFHIFTGLVGPYMVLLHSSWKFNGLAGIVTLLTATVVFSGFIGRYIYTAVPRTVDGVMVEAGELEQQALQIERDLESILQQAPEIASLVQSRLETVAPNQGAVSFLLVRPFQNLSQRLDWWQARRHLARQPLGQQARENLERLDLLIQRQRLLQRQVASLATARRLMSLWHAVHIPIGMALFTAALIHIGAAIYFATLLH